MKFRNRLKTLENHIFWPKNVIFQRFWPLSKFSFPACTTLITSHVELNLMELNVLMSLSNSTRIMIWLTSKVIHPWELTNVNGQLFPNYLIQSAVKNSELHRANAIFTVVTKQIISLKRPFWKHYFLILIPIILLKPLCGKKLIINTSKKVIIILAN